MLDSIIRCSLRNRLAVIVISLLVVIAGTYTALTMEVDVFPDLNAPTVVVMTEASGMAPEEVERMVTFPIETAMGGATGVRRVRSTSQTGFSCVWVEFDWGTDIYRDRQIVSEKLSEISSDFPASARRPTLGAQSSILGEVLIIGLTSDSTSQQDLRTIADWTIRPHLMSLGGVAQVSVHGGETREYQVQLHPERMRHHDVSISEAVEAVRGVSANVSGGVLYEYGNEYLIRGELATSDCDAIGQTVVKTVEGVPVLLSQIADIHIGNKTPKTGCASNNTKPAVLLTIAKQPGASTKELTQRLDKALEELKPTLPHDIKIDSEIFRQSRFIDASISNIKESLLEGTVFVVIVLLLFLLNIRTTVISLVTIPLALLVSILVLNALGLTVNTMSIGGMAIAIGSLVDDAIVDVENVYKRLRESAGKTVTTAGGMFNLRGYSAALQERLMTVFHASREVRLPILNSTFIVIAAFLPLFFLSGMEGRMLIPLGIAFIVSLFASTVVALTLTPVLCSYLLVPERLTHRAEPKLTRWLKTQYRRALEWAMLHTRMVFGGTIAALILAVGLFFGLGSDFLPPFNEGSFTISISTLPGISLEESDKIGRRAEELLMEVPEITTVARKTGRAELDEHAFGVNVSEIEAPFVLNNGRSRTELQQAVRERLATLPGVALEIGQPISHRIDAMLSGTRANIAIKIFGTDLNTMHTLGEKVKAAVADIPGVADLNVEQQVERPQLRITPRRNMLAKYGVTPQQFADYIRVLLDGETVSQIYEGNAAFDLTVKVADEDRNGMASIRDLMIDAGGQKIPLEYVANIESTVGPNAISRENAGRRIVVSANVDGRDLQSTANDIQERIAEKIDLPEGYRIEYGGQFENAANASRTLLLLSCLSLLIIFVLLYRQFGSAKQAVIVLINLPLALIGGVFALTMTGGELSIPAIIGFISLFGIATRNGILLIDRYNSGDVTVIEGSLDRLTPILMTALTSALALVPLALGGDLPGNEIQSPMAKVILGGLVTSTILNMFIVPLIYHHQMKTKTPTTAQGLSAMSHKFKSMTLLVCLVLLSLPTKATANYTLASYLEDIAAHNPRLAAYRAQRDAAVAGNRTGLSLPDPEVEFATLWGSQGGWRYDINASQGFDFSTLLGSKRKLARSRNELAEIECRQAEQLVRLAAVQLLCRISTANLKHDELDKRHRLIAHHDSTMQRLLNKGEVSKYERNKTRVVLADYEAALARDEVDRQLLLAELRNMGCTLSAEDFCIDEAGLTAALHALAANEGTGAEMQMAAAQQRERIAEDEIRGARHEGLPSFSLGYKSETEPDASLRGFGVSVSIPLWSNRHNVRRAKAERAAAAAETTATIAEIEGQREILRIRTRMLHEISERTAKSHAETSPTNLLHKALHAGEISLTDYLLEIEGSYTLYDKYLDANAEYLQALAELLLLGGE